MSYRDLEFIDNHLSSPFFIPIVPPKPLSINPFLTPSSDLHNDLPFSFLAFPYSLPHSFLNSVSTDLIHFDSTPFKRITRRVHSPELTHRTSSLESTFDQLLQLKEVEHKMLLNEVDRKYTWTAEIKGEVENKYKWTVEIKRDDDRKKGKRGERKYQWSREIKDDRQKRVYTWKATIGGEEDKEKKENKNGKGYTRIVEIEEPSHHIHSHRTIVLRQAFAKRTCNDKGTKKELSPFDAAALIQLSFRNYLIRRSQSLRAHRELAVAKTKLKELRAKFHNFSFHSRISRDAEERQKFSEKIIVLLLTMDAIEGIDLIVRAAKRSMVDELEAMLDVVDPQPGMRSLSMRRRTFDAQWYDSKRNC